MIVANPTKTPNKLSTLFSLIVFMIFALLPIAVSPLVLTSPCIVTGELDE